MDRVAAFADRAGTWFPLVVIAAGAVALLAPDVLGGWSDAVPWLLAVIMLGMGMTLRPVDFRYVARTPSAFAVGLGAQYVIMPLVGWLIVSVVPLAPELAVGVILVACAPGGTASNVMTFLARGDVALSVAMTGVSTLLAPLVTPLLVLWLAGSLLPVDPVSMLVSIAQVVLLPVVVGLLLRRFFAPTVERVLPVLPLVSMAGIVGVVVAVVADSADTLIAAGLVIVFVVVVHNLLGLALGYAAARALGLPTSAVRAITIETGMQNSGLAASLATAHFSPAAALPGAVFSAWHNISGSLLAGWWSRGRGADGAGPADPAGPADATRADHTRD